MIYTYNFFLFYFVLTATYNIHNESMMMVMTMMTTLVIVMMNSRNVFSKMLKIRICKTVFSRYFTWVKHGLAI